jgi:hypothetical protein
LISTITIISQKIIITKRRLPNINSRGVSRAANSNGNIIPKTEKVRPTGITTQPKNTTRGLQHKLPHAMHTGDGQSRGTAEGRVRQARPLRAEALSRVAEHSAVWTAAAVQKTSAAVEVPAVKACPAVVAGMVVVPVAAEGSAAVVAVVVEEDAAAVAAEGDNHVNISINHNETDEGERNDTSGNSG